MSAYRAAAPRLQKPVQRLRAPVSPVAAWTSVVFVLVVGLAAFWIGGTYRLRCGRAEGTCTRTCTYGLPLIATRRTFPVGQLRGAELVVEENEDDRDVYGVRLLSDASPTTEVLRGEISSDHLAEKRAFVEAVNAFVRDPARASLDVVGGNYRATLFWGLVIAFCVAVTHGARAVVTVDPERGRLTVRRWFGRTREAVPLEEIAFVRLNTRRSENDEADLTAVVLERRGKGMIELIGHSHGGVARKRRFAKELWRLCAPSCAEKSG